MDSVQIVKFYVPASNAEPVDVLVEHSGLRMVLVNRESIHLLDESWKVLGVYFLLGPAAEPDRYSAYVGEVGRATLTQRVGRHAAGEKEWWNRALLIASASGGFNSAEIGWLEGRLYDVLNNAVACDLKNGNRPGDESLPARERGVLERYVEPIMAALRACGAPPDTADQKTEVVPGRRPRRFTEKVADLIAAGLLKPGTRLSPRRSGITATATVRDDGQLELDGQAHATPSGAAKAAAGTVAEDGWYFWGAPSGQGGFVPLATLRDRLRNGQTVQPAQATVASAVASQPELAETQPQVAARKRSRPTPRKIPGTIAQLVDAGLLQPGTTLRSVRQRVEATATVDATGAIVVEGVAHKSPSGAAKAAAGTKAEDGWYFWLIEDAEGGTLADRRGRLGS